MPRSAYAFRDARGLRASIMRNRMSDDPLLAEEFPDVTLEDEIACVRRELSMRRRVYPSWVERGRMKAEQAARETRVMSAVLKRLLRAQAAGRLL